MGTDSEPLDVALTVEGGFAPLGPQPQVFRGSADSLAAEPARELRRAVADAVGAVPETSPERRSGRPDVLLYRLVVNGQVLVFDDVTATPPQHELVALVRRLARP